MLRLCHGLYGCSTVTPRLSTDTYGLLRKNWNFQTIWKLSPGKKEPTEARRFIPVYPGSLRSCLRQTYGIVTDIYGLKPWASGISNRESVIRALGPRGFYFASSAAWNALPVHLRDPDLSLNSFKTELKTRFFLDILTWLTLILLFLFVLRANAIVYKLACANVCTELNWIELTRQTN